VTGRQRTLTVLGAVAAVAVIGGVVALALSGGDDDADQTASTTTTLPATTSTTLGAGDDETTVTVGIICTTAEDASTSFVNAWLAGDPAAAKRCATDDAVATLFARSGAGAQYTFQGCDRTDPGVPICSYSYEGGAAQLKVEGTEAAGWKVTAVSYIAD
jgi:hypothetical protein